MNRPFVLLLFLLISISCVFSQSNTDYNSRGEQALLRGDYNEARTWFSEGLPSCNLNSIGQLTRIWEEQENMRRSLAMTMRRCFDCIKPLAEQKNPDAMHLLSEYYKYGIGVETDSIQSEVWYKEYLASQSPQIETEDDSIQTPDSTTLFSPKIPKKSILSDKFYSFASYTYSPTMPFGITIGGFSKYGLYFSYKTSESRNYDFECNNMEVIHTDLITDVKPLYQFDREDWTAEMITGGILFPLQKEKFYLSLGGGYAKRNYFRSIVSEDIIIEGRNSAWCYNTEASYQSAVVEVGGLFKWKKLILTGGVNSTGFKDLDGYIGLGISF